MTSTEIAAASKIMLGSTEAEAMYIGNTLLWPISSQEHDYSLDYFTIESLLDSNNILAVRHNSSISIVIYYSLDDGTTWSSKTLNTASIKLATINTGEKIMLKCTQNKWSAVWDKYNSLNPSKQFKVYGNVMSLLNGDNFTSNSEFESGSTHNLCGLFRGTTTIVDASNLILPATTLHESSYNGMFRGCSNLEHGPKLLPALDVPKDAYSSMFEGCVNLIEGPEILATTVSGDTALAKMFCMDRNNKVTAAMTKSPILRITDPIAYTNVYQQLFCGNGNLTEVTVLAEGKNIHFNKWLLNVSSSGVIKKLPELIFRYNDEHGIPPGWTTVEYTET